MCAIDTTSNLATAQETNQTPKAKPLHEVEGFEVGGRVWEVQEYIKS